MEIKINEDNEDLYCVYCKDSIQIGQKFITIIEEDSSGEYEKHYHCSEECAPEEEEDIYIPDLDDELEDELSDFDEDFEEEGEEY